MADSAISSLPAVEEIFSNDLFVLEQNGQAKKLLGQLLAAFIDRNILSVTVTSVAATAAPTASYNKSTGALTLGLPRGCGIANIQKESTSGLVDTYTITFEAPHGGTARPPITFTVTNGRGITKIEHTDGTHAPGTLDTYTITYNNGTTSTFQVYNGQDGEGSPGTANPKMDGTASPGTANAYSREDHVHPSDSTKVPTSRTVNGMALTGNITTRLIFENVSVSSWTELQPSAADYNSDFPFRGTLTCSGVTSSMIPEVILPIALAMSGDFAPIAKTDTNKIYIYSSSEPTDTVTVQTAIAWK